MNSSSKKRLMTLLFVLWGIPLMLIFGGAAWVNHVGMISVDVDEHGRGGSHVHLKIPAAMVQMALPFMPDVVCEKSSSQMRKWSPVMRELCGELSRMEDGVLVEVTGSSENVSIVKKGRSVLVDVISDDENVHVTMPIGTMSAVLQKLEGMARTKRNCGLHVEDGSVRL